MQSMASIQSKSSMQSEEFMASLESQAVTILGIRNFLKKGVIPIPRDGSDLSRRSQGTVGKLWLARGLGVQGDGTATATDLMDCHV
jgi:hypothetical protein